MVVPLYPSLLYLCFSVVSSSLSCIPRAGGVPVPLGVFMTSKRTDHDAPNIRPAIEVALDYIQNKSCILNGFKLELMYKDTGCTTSLGMRALFELIASRPRPVAIFGGLCTQVNEPVAMALKYWEVVQLSYAETHAKFASADSQDLYPTFFRIVPGDRNTNIAKCRLIRHFNWKKVGTIKQSDEPRYALPHEILTTKLEHGYGVKVVYTAGVTMHESESIGRELDQLKTRDVRIVVMDVASEMAAMVLCEAYHRQLFGDSYVWVIPGYHSTDWIHSAGMNCTLEQLGAVLEGHFAVEFALSRKDGDTVIATHTTAATIWNELSSVSDIIWRGYLFDGLWTLAIALSRTLEKDASFSHKQLLTAIYNTSFEGVTGKVRFENNERLGLVNVIQWKNGEYVRVGQFDGTSAVFEIEEENLDGWTAPLDSTIIQRKREYVADSLFVVMSFFSLIGIALALTFLGINIKYRNHRFIKMSSPNLNNLIIVGSMCTFASVVFLGIDTRTLSPPAFVNFCYVKTWTMCIGFTLAFGSMFSKTWRVHSIFTNIRMDRKAIKDSKLLLILAILLLGDIVVLTTWAVVSPFHLSVTELPKIHLENKVIIPIVEKCHSMNAMPFQAIIYATKGVLMILGCFLAWETRHVNVPALNDSKYIGMSVYGVVVTSILALSISVILEERVNEAFALTAFFIIFSTSLTLCLVFVPKVIELARNPQGNEQRGYRRGMMKSVVAKSTQANQSSLHSLKTVDRDLLAKAETENKLRRRYLHQKSTQLWDLMDKLREYGDTEFLDQEWCYSNRTEGVATESCLLLESSRLDVTENESSIFSNGKGLEWSMVDPDEQSTML